jgi:uncharacterized protein (TIGR02996 family)
MRVDSSPAGLTNVSADRYTAWKSILGGLVMAGVVLNDEYLYRIAPDGKSVQAARDLVRRGAFRDPKMSAGGTAFEAACQGSEPKPYRVRVDLADPDRPRTSCTCISPKTPCKHALGLLVLAEQQPEAFTSSGRVGLSGRLHRFEETKARKSPAEESKPPTDVGEALYQAILDDPEDDASRLVYADWLEENGGPAGQARAEFIRVQVELARGATPARAKELKSIEQRLWSEHRASWLSTLPPHLRKRDIYFQRGFLDELRMPAQLWAKHGAGLFGKNPIYRVRLSGTVSRHESSNLVVIPHLSRIRILSLEGATIDEPLKTLQILVTSPFWSSLRRLVLRGCGIGTREVGVIAEHARMPGLREIDLADNHVGPKGAEQLAAASWVAGLKELSLANNPLGDAGARALADSPHLGGLERLDLDGVELGPGARKALRERFGERAVLGGQEA